MSSWLESHLFINHALGGLFYISFYFTYCGFILYISWVIFDIGIMPTWCKHLICILIWLISLVILCIELR